MNRIIHLFDPGADFQTRRSVQTLRAGLGEGFEIELRQIGRGGDFRNTTDAVRGLRRPAFAAGESGRQGEWNVDRRHYGDAGCAGAGNREGD